MISLEKYKAGTFEKSHTGYNYFQPSKINDNWSWNNQEINNLSEKAALKLGELNAYAKIVPNIDLFIHLHVTKEAVVSSRIEGTQTNMNEALLQESEILPERKDDWREVINYTNALNQAIDELGQLPISSRLLKKIHTTLMDSVRGEHKQPGEYRRSQNWIGGNSLADAIFIPPHHQFVEELMSDLENFLHTPNIQVPDLIRIGIAHYQFETIHPFLDGNGRIGRLLITLFLIDKKILAKPLLYVSSFFEKNKSLYYDNLTLVRTKNDMIQWLKYFLVGIAETAQKATETLVQIFDLKTTLEKKIRDTFGKKTKNASLLLHHLFHNPVLNVIETQEITRLSFKAANDLLIDFIKANILQEVTGQSRNRIFIFDSYLKLFNND